MIDSCPPSSLPASIGRVVAELDPLMIWIGLALAGFPPTLLARLVRWRLFPMTFRKRWFWAGFSATSMLPVVGYLPAS